MSYNNKMYTKLKGFSVPGAFCPNILQRTEINYDDELPRALSNYPGAKGDAVTALSFVAKHRQMSVNNAKEQITNLVNSLINDLESEAYQSAWVDEYLDYFNPF